MNFSHPWLFALSLFALALYFLQFARRSKTSFAIGLSSLSWIPSIRGSRLPESMIPRLLRLVAALSLLPILAGIGSEVPLDASRNLPPALMVVLDGSSSMTAEDFQPENRLQEAKKVLKVFVARNPEVEIGLVVFAATAQLLVPVTSDHGAVQTALDGVSPAAYGEDGTAIGSGIASALNRLRGGVWSQRSILLITDGVSNRGAVSPLDTARLATELGVPIHAVGMGTDGLSRYFVPRPDGGTLELRARIEIDDEALLTVARDSGGTYQRVENSEELALALTKLRISAQAVQGTVTLGPNHLWPQSLAAFTILLLVTEFILTQFVLSELPG